MFKELVAQAKRLFSSKSNGGRLVYKLTDRLHGYKQALLATSIVVLLGYSQFRQHFKCQGQGSVDSKILTDFCWINGTTTINSKNPASTPADRYITHIGIQFKQVADGRYEILNHNYMRSLWALLILMAVCSFIAQRWWASIFSSDILKALLQLPGHERSLLVKRAQKLKPYYKIIELSTKKNSIKRDSEQAETTIGNKKLNQILVLTQTIDSITGDQNEHNHILDYYPNQLLYLLLARSTYAYKLSGLKLRRKLLSYSIFSFLLTLMQFVLPLLFIGPEYLNYGLSYAKAWLYYTLKQIINPRSTSVNSIDYEISSRIWPTSTSCEYRHYGYLNQDRIIVQCTVSINEICAKLFVVIWWFTVINIIIELYALISSLIFSLSFKMIKWNFERKFSPRTRREAKVIATFRYKRAMFLHELTVGASDTAKGMYESALKIDMGAINETGGEGFKAASHEHSERDMKVREAESEQSKDNGSRLSLSAKKWCLWCSRDLCMFLTDKSEKVGPSKLATKHKSPKDDLGYKELREDMNIYYLLDLLFLRLNCSRKKLEQIVRMTSDALATYLETIDQLEAQREEQEDVPVIKVNKSV